MHDPRDGKVLDIDAWDGYQATRDRLSQAMENGHVDNLVVLTGDMHISMALEVIADPWDHMLLEAIHRGERKAIGVEIVAPSVSSVALEATPGAALVPAGLKAVNPHLKWVEVTKKGYVLLDVDEDRVQAEWFFVVDHKRKTPGEYLGAIYVCEQGQAKLRAGKAVTEPKRGAPRLAPEG
jgi:alkaline phosphatase D